MRKLIILLALTSLAISGVAFAQDGARPGSQTDTTPPATTFGGSGSQDVGFEDVAALLAGDWDSINTSDDVAGAANPDWVQGTDATVNMGPFDAHAGPIDSYASSNFNATGGSQISNWLLVPDVGFLQSATFYTRTVTGNTFPDRMQVRFSDVGGTNVGTDVTTVGDYDNLLVDINPTLATGGYPDDWTEFTVNPGGEGRLAFRYFVDTAAGPVGSNSNFIGVDSLTLVIGGEPPPVPAVPTMGVFGLIALGLLLVLGTMLARRRQSL